jgi:hypothetical protein
VLSSEVSLLSEPVFAVADEVLNRAYWGDEVAVLADDVVRTFVPSSVDEVESGGGDCSYEMAATELGAEDDLFVWAVGGLCRTVVEQANGADGVF